MADAGWLQIGLTAGEAIARLRRDLALAGVATPGTDARLLVGAALGRAQTELLAHPAIAFDTVALQRLAAYRRRRIAREPVSRILGEREFYGRVFRLSPATLDPRPDSETLIEAALSWARRGDRAGRPLRILDIGTGSGCLLLTLLAELPAATGLGTDISAEALVTAHANAELLGLSGRVDLRLARSLEGIDGPFDLLVSNPPYIPSPDIAGLEAEVRLYDPPAALDGGTDGLDVYRELIAGARRVVPSGLVILEVGAGQAEDVVRLALSTGLPRESIETFDDLGRHTRCVAFEHQDNTAL